MTEAVREWENKRMDGTRGIGKLKTGDRGCARQNDSQRRSPSDYSEAPVAQTPPEAWGFPGMGPTEPLPVPQSHGIAVVLFFQLRQHSRETGGGPGVMGTFPKHGSSWRRGHPQLCMAWGGQLKPAVCMATAGSTRRCFAWLECSSVHEPGGRKGSVALSPGLWN